MKPCRPEDKFTPRKASLAVLSLALFILQVTLFYFRWYAGDGGGSIAGHAAPRALEGMVKGLGVAGTENLLFLGSVLLNCALTVGIMACFFKKLQYIKLSAFLLSAGVVFYIVANLAGKALDVMPIRVLSVETATFLCSPLVTLCLLPALMLVRNQMIITPGRNP